MPMHFKGQKDFCVARNIEAWINNNYYNLLIDTGGRMDGYI